MKKQLTKWLAMLLCIALVFDLFPETTFATELQRETQTEEIAEDEVSLEEEPITDETVTEQNMEDEVLSEEESIADETVTEQEKVEIIEETDEKFSENVSIEIQERKAENMDNDLVETSNITKSVSQSTLLTSTSIVDVNCDSYEQYLAYYYLTYSSLDFYLENDELPYHTYVNNNIEEFEETLGTWRIVNMKASDLTSYSSKEVDFYVLLLYDIAYQKVYKKSLVSEVDSAADAMMLSTLADLAKKASGEAIEILPDLDIMEDNWEEVLNTLCTAETLKDIAKYSGILLKCIDYVGTVDDLFNKIYMMQEFINCSDELEIILDDIYQNTTDDLIKEACQQLKLVSTGLLTENEIVKIFGGDILCDEITGIVLDKLWEIAISNNAVFAGAEIGKKVGKLASNLICSTDGIVENWYSMDKVYKLEKVLKSRLQTYINRYENDPTHENAKLLNEMSEMYLNTLSVGMEYAVKYVENVKGNGILGWIYKNFTHKDDYESMMESLNSIKKAIDDEVKLINNESYNFYLDSMEENSEYAEDCAKTTCDVTREEITAEVTKLPDYLFELTDQTTTEDTSFTSNKRTYANYYHENGMLDLQGQTLTVYGDFFLNGGSVELNGGTLNIYGDLYVKSDLSLTYGAILVEGNIIHTEGQLTLNKGTLEVTGDYYLAKPTTNSVGDETWDVSWGVLIMQYDEDTVKVGGTFWTQTKTNLISVYTAGTLYVGGDFVAKSVSTKYPSFNASGTHTVILNGTKTQTVHMEMADAENRFANLQSTNPNPIIVTNVLQITTLQTDLSICTDSVQVYDFNVNGHTVEIEGDVIIVGGDINLSNGILTIKGDTVIEGGDLNLVKGTLSIEDNLIHKNGNVVLNKGTLSVGRDYRIQSQYIDSAGDIAWSGSSGVLQMAYEEDRVSVAGDFVYHSETHQSTAMTAGTLEVAGDFIHIDGSSCFVGYNFNFISKDTHTIVFNGKEPQKLSIASYVCTLANVQVTNPSGLIVDNYMNITSLHSDTKIQSENMKLLNFDLNGNTVDIIGNVYHEGGTLRISNGNLNIVGDFYSTDGNIIMENDEDVFKVSGDFTINNNIPWNQDSNVFSAGILRVGGDFAQKVDHSNYIFTSYGTHKVILDGENAQKLCFEYSGSTISDLEVQNPEGIICNQYFSTDSLKTSNDILYIKSEGMIIKNVNVEAPEVEIAGDVSLEGSFNLNGNTVDIIGDVQHKGGTLKISSGTLNIVGDFCSTDGNIIMENDEDVFKVSGDFTINNYISWSQDSNVFSAGILKVGGDFAQKVDHSDYVFTSYGTHKVILDGKNAQRISFEYSGSAISNLEVQNPEGIICDQYFSVNSLNSTNAVLNIKSEGMLLKDVNVKTQKVVITGDVTKIGGTFSLLTSNCKIIGNLIQNSGTVAIGKGTLEITEDYRLQTKAINELDEVVWNASDGILQMKYDEGKLIVGNDFVMNSSKGSSCEFSAGTLAVGRSFYQYGTSKYYKFLATGVHETVLCGYSSPEVLFEADTSQFNILKLAKYKTDYTFNQFCWNTLEENVDVTSELFGKNIEYGECGNNLNYAINEKGVLVIEGSGSMENYSRATEVPWYDYKDQIVDVILNKNVNSIGTYAFSGCKNLKTITIPQAMISIGEYAFQGCNSLEKIQLSDNITYIGNNAFKNCVKITFYCTKDSYAHKYAVKNNIPYKLEAKECPVDELTAIADSQWIGDANEGPASYVLDGDPFTHWHTNWSTSEGSSVDNRWIGVILKEASYIEGIRYLPRTYNGLNGAVTEYKIQYSASEDGEWVDLTTGTWDYNNDDWKEVKFDTVYAKKVRLIGVHTYADSGTDAHMSTAEFRVLLSSDESSIVPEEHKHDFIDDVCTICGQTLLASGYSGYTTWVLTDDHVLTFSGEGAMKNYASKSAMPWYDYMDQIESIVIEEGVTSIGEYAFYGMPKLTSITIPESVVSIGAYAFKGSTALDGVVLPSKLTQLGESAFYGCTSLTAINIPASLYTVRPYTFKNCTSLAKVTFHEGNLQKLSDASFYGTALTEVTIPDCATIVDVYCFKNCSQLASVTLSSNMTQIREAVFYGTAIPAIEIPEGVTKIGPYAFKNCTNLTSISLPTTLTSVDEASFYACTALEKVEFPDAVTAIGNYAFRKCEKLTSVTFSDELQTIGESSFYGCIGLTSLEIPEGVTEIKGYALKGCTAVTEVSLPGTLVTLGESALYGCTALGTIVIPENVAAVGDYAFSRCSGLYKVQFTGNAPSIGSGAFSKVKATVTYPADKTGWSADVMQNYGGTLTWKAN